MTSARFPFRDKTVVGMAHFPALPGAPFYDRSGGMEKIVDSIVADVTALQDGGIDAIMFGNEGDRPYTTASPVESVAAMAAVIGQVKPMLKVPFGVNYLWNPKATVALGAATGRVFRPRDHDRRLCQRHGDVGARRDGGDAAARRTGPATTSR